MLVHYKIGDPVSYVDLGELLWVVADKRKCSAMTAISLLAVKLEWFGGDELIPLAICSSVFKSPQDRSFFCLHYFPQYLFTSKCPVVVPKMSE